MDGLEQQPALLDVGQAHDFRHGFLPAGCRSLLRESDVGDTGENQKHDERKEDG